MPLEGPKIAREILGFQTSIKRFFRFSEIFIDSKDPLKISKTLKAFVVGVFLKFSRFSKIFVCKLVNLFRSGHKSIQIRDPISSLAIL